MSEYRWPTEGITENALDAIAREHGLFVGPGGNELVGEDLADERAPLADIDIAFAKRNPNLPIENVCSRLDNYQPQNESQQALLGMANKLVSYVNPSRLAGFIACGAAGLGKTHVAVGAAKASMLTGQKALYVNVPSGSQTDHRAFEKANSSDIVIIDDLNAPYGGAFDASSTRKLLGLMHDRGGGKLMITSNTPDIATFLDRILLPHDPFEKMRIQDRVASALLGLEINGESFRSQSSVGQTPWWEE